MNINLTLIVQMLVFIVLIWFTMKFVWPIITGAMEERAKKIALGLAAAEKGRSGHNYILGGNEASYAEIVQMVGKLLGQPTNTVVGRPLVLRGAGRVSEWISMLTGKEPRISQESAALVSASIICRSDKAMRELDYRPASVEAMLKECIDWMIAENLIGPRAVPH